MRSPASYRLAGVLLLLAACATDDGTDGAAGTGPRTVTTSVGDTVVVRTTGEDTVARRLVPELRIGEMEGDEAYSFGTVDDVAPAPDGGVFVWDRQSREVRRYDRAGRFVRQVGRRGAGPGEYEGVGGSLVVAGGRLLLWDGPSQHLNVYDSSGAFVRSWVPAHPQVGIGELQPGVGDRVWLRHLLEPWAGDERPMALAWIAFDADGRPAGDTVPQPPVTRSRSMVEARGPRMQSGATVPFTPTARPVLSPRGEVVSGTGERYALLVTRPGQRPRRIERDAPAAVVSEAERAAAAARVTAALRQADPQWRWNGPPIPSRKPYFRRVHFGLDGRLWVARALASTRIPDDELPAPPPSPVGPRDGGAIPAPPPQRWRDSVVYDVFEPDGRFLGTVPQPPGTTFLRMRGDTVWGAVRDSLDVAYVARWHVEPALAAVRPR